MFSVPLIVDTMSSIMSNKRTLEAITSVKKAMPINGILSEEQTCKILQEVLNGRKIKIYGKKFAIPHNRITRIIQKIIHRLRLFSSNYRREFVKSTWLIYLYLLRYSQNPKVNPLLRTIKYTNIAGIQFFYTEAINYYTEAVYRCAKTSYKENFLKTRKALLEQEKNVKDAAQSAIKKALTLNHSWSGIKSVHHNLPKEISHEILSLARTHLSECALVSKEWRQMVYDEALYKKIVPIERFGADAWKQYIGDPGEEPLLPLCIFKDIEKGSGLLTLVPEQVSILNKKGESITVSINLKNIGKLVQNPKLGVKTGYHPNNNPNNMNEIDGKRYFQDESLEDIQKEAIQDQLAKEPEKSHWVWIYKEPVGKGELLWPMQKQLVVNQSLEKDGTNGSHVSNVLDTIVTLFMEKLKTGKSTFNIDEINDFWIRVQERHTMLIYRGICFTNYGLQITRAFEKNPIIGSRDRLAVLAARKSFGRVIK